ncbi:major facilitator superfamily protein (plasmid) [Rhizobium etli bv. phaseoli str. IE4803]|nr:major facilitator superfamily protein [Rhizobium etli bv. phaseoli str. IE4803]ARO26653.1 major facilitator superfamily protein [Rhizobium sp. TAL182]
MQLPVGLLFDRFGCRLPMTALALCGAVGSAMIATATSFAHALLGQGLIGMGCAPAIMGIYFHYGQALPWQKAARGRDHGRHHRVAWSFGLRNAARAACFNARLAIRGRGVGVLYDLGIGLALYLSQYRSKRGKPDARRGKPLSEQCRVSDLPVTYLLSASLGTVFRSAWASPYLMEVVKLSSQQAANAFAAVSAAGTLTGVVLALAMKRWSAGSIVGALYGVAIVLTTALAFDPAQNVFVAAIVLSTLYSISNCHTIALAEAQEHISARRRGMILGVLNGLGFVGVASSSPIFGMIARSLEPSPAFTAMFAATAAVLTGSLVLYMFRSRMR